VKRGLFALVCLICMAGWLASTAAACHSEITATIDCSGKVTYTATAWNGSGATTTSRTNSDVRVYASYDNGATYTQVGSGHFGSDDNFSFSGSFSAGSAASVIVKVQEATRWANGDAPAPPRFVTATKGTCAPPPPTCPSTGMVAPGPIAIAGATATVSFTVAAGCKDIQLSLVSYKAPSATFDEQTADQQVLFDSKTATYGAGTYALTVAMPGCYYQVDFVYGTPITKLGPAGTNNFYGKQNRLIEAANGGRVSCSPPTTPPPTTPPPTITPPPTPPPTSTPPAETPPVVTPPAEVPPVTITPASTPQATSTVTQPVVKKAVHTTKKKAVHKKKVVHKKKAAKKTVKKVTKKAKPARPVTARAHFTG
jgi:hypothetical protein